MLQAEVLRDFRFWIHYALKTFCQGFHLAHKPTGAISKNIPLSEVPRGMPERFLRKGWQIFDFLFGPLLLHFRALIWENMIQAAEVT